ncbi:hypothetical protein ACUN0C_01850 [Faunimonas sp. B44]|uniref:hypothetical protein n=1 Tax=Faunimonas sp. B44 TaxID=3461493 RepID=UPI004043C0C8
MSGFAMEYLVLALVVVGLVAVIGEILMRDPAFGLALLQDSEAAARARSPRSARRAPVAANFNRAQAQLPRAA